MVSALGVATLLSAWALADALQLNASTVLEEPPDPDDDFCIEGRLAPRFFLLGAPKSGTTFFYEDFARSEGLAQYAAINEAEWHSKEPWVFAGRFAADEIRAWLQHYPRCEDAKNKVAVDCTPGYLGDERAAWNIKSAYPLNLHPHLVFMVFLRNPVDRAHSHYYQFLDNGVMNGAFQLCRPEQFPATFEKAAIALLDSPDGRICDCDCNYIFSNSFYTDAFKNYFRHWKPVQFHIVPFNKAVGHEIVQYTWDLLHIPQGWGEKGDLAGSGNTENHHSYPILKAEMGAELLRRFETFMTERTGARAVAEVIADTKATLFKFDGSRNVETVADWLHENWCL